MTDYKDRVSGCATDIDWSKAPEGATHYMPETESSHAVWVMVSGNTRLAWLASGDSRWEIDRSLEEDREYLIPRPAPQWNGEGLPPVGTECEIAASTEYLKISYPEGAKVKIYAHFKHDSGRELAAFVDQNCQVYGIGMAKIFAPIKTPAQIAADEREAAIEAMIGKIKDHPLKYQSVSHFAQLKIQEDACADLYDAGLRFPKGDDK